MKRILLAAIALVAIGFVLAWTPASAAEVTLICSNALKSVMEEIGPQFEKATGHKLKATYGSTGPLTASIDKGAVFDVAILGVGATDDLIKQGKLVAGTRADIARSGMGVAIRPGLPKPDIGSVDAFERALLSAKSIGYSEDGLTGKYLKGLFVKLGIADELKAKTVHGRGGELVGEGKADLGLTQVSEILPVKRAELLGPLPSGVQEYTVFPGAAATATKEPDAAKALLKFLVSPDAGKVIRAHGLEPAA
jgi:molybdate transport system substrate-binding protein